MNRPPENHDWTARWIWDRPDSREQNAYLYFRKVLHLPDGGPFTAPVRVCADTQYKLYANGDFVHHGPARSDPRRQQFDHYDIGEKLRPGKNVIAALVCHEGVGTCASLVNRGGFLLEVEVAADGFSLLVGTDETWKARRAPYQGGYERISIQLAFPEEFDAREEPVGWNAPGFDDSGWQSAVALGEVGMEPWTTLVPRAIPMQRYRCIAPAELIQVNVVERADDAGITPAEAMERATRLQPALSGAVTWKHPALFTVAPVPGTTGTSVVLDYGREVSGYPWLQVRKGGGGRVDVGYSERIEADGSVNPNRFGGCAVHYTDRVHLRSGPQRWTPFHPRAFRYLRLDFYDCPEPLEILAEMDTFGYPVENRGDFHCSDPLLNRIWEVGRETAALCMDDAYMDCPWRERGQWLADTRVEALVSQYAFGDWKLARNAWLQYAESQGTSDAYSGEGETPAHHRDNWLKCVYPAAPPFDSVLPTFNCLWFNGLWEHFLHTGDRGLLQEVWPRAEKLLALLRRHESDDGLLADLPGWVFVDWAKLEVRGEASHVNAFYYGALLAAAKIARAVGKPEMGGDLQMHATDVRDSINDLLWDNTAGLYVDCRTAEGPSGTYSEQANVLCVLYGIADLAQTERILSTLYGGSKSQQEITRIATPYFAFYLLRALYGLGRHAQALDYTREKWGQMLARGATAFWEQFEPEWSLCHAWSAAPTYDLPAEIAGIRPTQPGFEEFTVKLRPVDLTWLRATVPTIRGDIKVSYHYRTDQPFVDHMGGAHPLPVTEPAITVNLEAPKGTRAELSIPLSGIIEPIVRVNGEPWVSADPATDSGGYRIEGDLVRLSLPGGRFQLTVTRSAADNGDSR